MTTNIFVHFIFYRLCQDIIKHIKTGSTIGCFVFFIFSYIVGEVLAFFQGRSQWGDGLTANGPEF